MAQQVVAAQLVGGPAAHQLDVTFDFGTKISKANERLGVASAAPAAIIVRLRRRSKIWQGRGPPALARSLAQVINHSRTIPVARPITNPATKPNTRNSQAPKRDGGSGRHEASPSGVDLSRQIIGVVEPVFKSISSPDHRAHPRLGRPFMDTGWPKKGGPPTRAARSGGSKPPVAVAAHRLDFRNFGCEAVVAPERPRRWPLVHLHSYPPALRFERGFNPSAWLLQILAGINFDDSSCAGSDRTFSVIADMFSNLWKSVHDGLLSRTSQSKTPLIFLGRQRRVGP